MFTAVQADASKGERSSVYGIGEDDYSEYLAISSRDNKNSNSTYYNAFYTPSIEATTYARNRRSEGAQEITGMTKKRSFFPTQFRSTLIIVDDSTVLCSVPPTDYLGFATVSLAVHEVQFATRARIEFVPSYFLDYDGLAFSLQQSVRRGFNDKISDKFAAKIQGNQGPEELCEEIIGPEKAGFERRQFDFASKWANRSSASVEWAESWLMAAKTKFCEYRYSAKARKTVLSKMNDR